MKNGDPYLLGHIFMYEILFQLRLSHVVRLLQARYVWKRTREATIRMNRKMASAEKNPAQFRVRLSADHQPETANPKAYTS